MTISTKALLAELNELREEAGMKLLITWKSSRTKLEEAIDKLDTTNDPARENRPFKNPPPKVAKKAPAVKTAVTTKAPPVDKADGLLSISDIAKSLNMDPKVARAKLRRNGLSSDDGRWARIKPDSKEHQEIIKTMKRGKKVHAEDIE